MYDVSFSRVEDTQLLWRCSPVLRAAAKTLNFLAENGPIGLTPNKALKRYFVEWAAEVFEWPGYGPAELYAVNKVLNEEDFPPLSVLHDLLLAMRLARHYKGKLVITRVGRSALQELPELWAVLLAGLLFQTDHGDYMRHHYQFDGDWSMILEVINVEAHGGASGDRLCAALLDASEAAIRRDHVVHSIIYMYVLRPLTWCGLLTEIPTGSKLSRENVYFKTPLWEAALTLPGDEQLPARALH